jgi:hypothetical protein
MLEGRFMMGLFGSRWTLDPTPLVHVPVLFSHKKAAAASNNLRTGDAKLDPHDSSQLLSRSIRQESEGSSDTADASLATI